MKIDILEMLNLQIVLFILMLVGFISIKKNIISSSSRKSFSDLLINFVLPCNIIASFMSQKFTADMLVKSVTILLVSFGVQILNIIMSKFLYRGIEHDKQMVLRYATICSNATFIGLPIIGGIYGDEGILYTSIALLPLRISMWSAGLALFTVTSRKDTIKTLVTHPCIIAVFIGFAIMILNIPLPVFLSKSIISLSNCNTFLSMLVIGMILGEIDFKTVFSKLVIYYAFVRLALMPIIIYIILTVLGIDSVVRGVATLMAAMPAGSTTAILASKYDCDAQFASKVIFVSTLISMASIPLFGFIL